MANPNMGTATSILGQTALVNLTTNTSNVITNATASNTIVKLNDVMLTNRTTSNVYANVFVTRSSTDYFQLGNVAIPAQSAMVVVGKDTQFYLEEGDVLRCNVSANTAVTVTASYEIIS